CPHSCAQLSLLRPSYTCPLFFFTATPTPEIYTLSLHDALPISSIMYLKDALDKFGINMQVVRVGTYKSAVEPFTMNQMSPANREDRKSTRLNSSHVKISYAVFCLKKKKTKKTQKQQTQETTTSQ